MTALTALLAVLAHPTASVLHTWQTQGAAGFSCNEQLSRRESPAGLHGRGCEHRQSGAHHDSAACPVCRSLQQGVARLAAVHGLREVLPPLGAIVVASSCGALTRLVHGPAAPRAPPALA